MTIAPLLLLLATPPPELGTSPLVTPETVHDWVQLPESEGGEAWIDRSFHDSILHERASFPVVLLRFWLKRESQQRTGDIVLAVDCKERQMAIVVAWDSGDGAILAAYDRPEGMTFDFATEPFEEADIVIFRQACGADWQP